MIPVGDNVPRRCDPIVNWCLIIANVVVFFIELAQGPDVEAFVYRWAVVPAVLTGQVGAAADAPPPVVTVFSAMFLHAGWGHLLGNMLFLWIFGDNVEDAMGQVRYLVFYLLCGVVATFAFVALAPGTTAPSLGASGAISGVLAAYLIMHPRAMVLVVIPLFLLFPVVQVPAFLMLGLWILTQFIYGVASLAATNEGGGVAWWAHVGGFVAGVVLLPLFRRRREEYLTAEYR
ncbi:MAG: rhomboid family intramembrane serine protease [Sulfurifustis sp.]